MKSYKNEEKREKKWRVWSDDKAMRAGVQAAFNETYTVLWNIFWVLIFILIAIVSALAGVASYVVLLGFK